MEATIERLDGIIEVLMAELEARHDLKTAQTLEITVRVRAMYTELQQWEADDETEE